MSMRSKLVALAIVSVAFSCEPAKIAAPAADGAADAWELASEWPTLPVDRKLGRVLGVAIDARGRVWISHTGEDGAPPGILALDPDSGVVVDEIDARSFRSPHALAWDDQGQLWVTDDGADRVVVLDERGQILRTIGDD